MKTWQEMAKLALDVQDACNLSGVVHSFSEVIRDVRENLRAEGKESTDTINSHPICVLFSSKIASLTHSEATGAGGLTAFVGAYVWAQSQVK